MAGERFESYEIPRKPDSIKKLERNIERYEQRANQLEREYIEIQKRYNLDTLRELEYGAGGLRRILFLEEILNNIFGATVGQQRNRLEAEAEIARWKTKRDANLQNLREQLNAFQTLTGVDYLTYKQNGGWTWLSRQSRSSNRGVFAPAKIQVRPVSYQARRGASAPKQAPEVVETSIELTDYPQIKSVDDLIKIWKQKKNIDLNKGNLSANINKNVQIDKTPTGTYIMVFDKTIPSTELNQNRFIAVIPLAYHDALKTEIALIKAQKKAPAEQVKELEGAEKRLEVKKQGAEQEVKIKARNELIEHELDIIKFDTLVSKEFADRFLSLSPDSTAVFLYHKEVIQRLLDQKGDVKKEVELMKTQLGPDKTREILNLPALYKDYFPYIQAKYDEAKKENPHINLTQMETLFMQTMSEQDDKRLMIYKTLYPESDEAPRREFLTELRDVMEGKDPVTQVVNEELDKIGFQPDQLIEPVKKKGLIPALQGLIQNSKGSEFHKGIATVLTKVGIPIATIYFGYKLLKKLFDKTEAKGWGWLGLLGAELGVNLATGKSIFGTAIHLMYGGAFSDRENTSFFSGGRDATKVAQSAVESGGKSKEERKEDMGKRLFVGFVMGGLSYDKFKDFIKYEDGQVVGVQVEKLKEYYKKTSPQNDESLEILLDIEKSFGKEHIQAMFVSGMEGLGWYNEQSMANRVKEAGKDGNTTVWEIIKTMIKKQQEEMQRSVVETFKKGSNPGSSREGESPKPRLGGAVAGAAQVAKPSPKPEPGRPQAPAEQAGRPEAGKPEVAQETAEQKQARERIEKINEVLSELKSMKEQLQKNIKQNKFTDAKLLRDMLQNINPKLVALGKEELNLNNLSTFDADLDKTIQDLGQEVQDLQQKIKVPEKPKQQAVEPVPGTQGLVVRAATKQVPEKTPEQKEEEQILALIGRVKEVKQKITESGLLALNTSDNIEKIQALQADLEKKGIKISQISFIANPESEINSVIRQLQSKIV